MKKVVFLDLDGVLADFDASVANHIQDPPEMFVPGFFRNLKVMPGAHKAVAQLLSNPDLDIYIGSKPTTGNLLSTVEKYEWVAVHFPRLLKRIVLVCNKALLRGDFLVDDDKDRWAYKFQGTFLHFDKTKSEESWQGMVEYLNRSTEEFKK
jgi:5'(3')-deoxyribonucleotidase